MHAKLYCMLSLVLLASCGEDNFTKIKKLRSEQTYLKFECHSLQLRYNKIDKYVFKVIDAGIDARNPGGRSKIENLQILLNSIYDEFYQEGFNENYNSTDDASYVKALQQYRDDTAREIAFCLHKNLDNSREILKLDLEMSK